MSRLTPRTTVRPPYDFVRSCVLSVDISRTLLALAVAAFGPRPDLLVAVHHDSIRGLHKGQRRADRLAAAFVENRRWQPFDDVGLFVGGVRHPVAGRRPV